MRRLRLLPFLTACLAAAPTRAVAQEVSPAEREAARDLYKEGYELQSAGNHAAALERFRRSQRVYPAPTTLLHIAECEAQLLQLVESAETYRQLVHQQLPPGSSPAFVAAQTQGAAELQQVEPRIPHVRIDVSPAGVPNLTVTIDDQPMNTALLGVDRPLDPGDHKVVAAAPGYERAEATVRVVEREPTRALTLTLRPGAAGALPAPVPVPIGAPPPQPQVIYLGQPYYAPPPPSAPPAPLAPPASPAGPLSRKGLFFGLRLGGAVPYGDGLTSDVAPGFSVGGEVDFRFARRLFVGAIVDHAFLGTNTSSSVSGLGLGGATYETTGAVAVFGILTNPDRFGALFEVGGGYRVLTATLGSVSSSLDSPELQLGAGLWIPIGGRVRLAPRVDTTFGSFQGADLTGRQVTQGYAMITLALGGYYNIDFR